MSKFLDDLLCSDAGQSACAGALDWASQGFNDTNLAGTLPAPMRACHKIWIEQCDTSRDIREAFGLQKAVGHLVGEKSRRRPRDLVPQD